MTSSEFTPIVFAASLGAGFLGALTGLGGGVIVTPVLTLFLGVDLRYAIGASLVSVIATSSGAAAAYVRDGLSNIRIGMFLEIATTIGAIFGAFLGTIVPTKDLAILFGLILLQSAWQTIRQHTSFSSEPVPRDALADALQLNGSFEIAGKKENYVVTRVKTGFALMLGAGTVSGLLGIGSGSLKVIAMDQAMRIPFKVSTATSSFMIGVTAAASASVYLSRGYVEPAIAMPVMLGVLLGATIGARVLPVLPVVTLRRLFAIVVGVIAIQMIFNGIRGRI